MDGVDLKLAALVTDQGAVLVPEHAGSFERVEQ